MFNHTGERFVRLVQYGSCYRSLDEIVENGTITLRNGENVTTVKIKDGLNRETKVIKNGRLKKWIKYGEFERARDHGVTWKIMHYRQNTGKALHGLCARKDFLLEGYPGTCYTFYSRGKFLWQKFIYSNKVTAYYLRWKDTEIRAVSPDKKPLFEIKVNLLYVKGNKEGDPFIYHTHYEAQPHNHSADGVYCSYVFFDTLGRTKTQGVFENNQKTGEWIENYKKFFYVNGLAVPKKLYETKPEDIDPNSILKMDNAQVRAMFLKKVGYDRVIKECSGQIIHKDGKYELIDFPVKVADPKDEQEDRFLRILKVPCPSTKQYYFLKIPPVDAFNTCAKARNGTFTHFELNAKPVEFAEET